VIALKGDTNGRILENTLRDVANRRKLSANASQYEDVFWPYPLWHDLWQELKSQGGFTGEPDRKLPIHVKTSWFTLRIHVLPDDMPRVN
jgi:hypothetical protein